MIPNQTVFAAEIFSVVSETILKFELKDCTLIESESSITKCSNVLFVKETGKIILKN